MPKKSPAKKNNPKAAPESRRNKNFTHLNAKGEMHMVDVSGKPVTHRTAIATAQFQSDARVIKMLISGSGKKGDALAAARLAGIIGAKKASSIIPLCHPLALTSVDVTILRRSKITLIITARCQTDGKTGVEMEAMLAVAAAALTLYDMSKGINRASRIGPIMLQFKDGGKSGPFMRRKNGRKKSAGKKS